MKKHATAPPSAQLFWDAPSPATNIPPSIVMVILGRDHGHLHRQTLPARSSGSSREVPSWVSLHLRPRESILASKAAGTIASPPSEEQPFLEARDQSWRHSQGHLHRHRGGRRAAPTRSFAMLSTEVTPESSRTLLCGAHQRGSSLHHRRANLFGWILAAEDIPQKAQRPSAISNNYWEVLLLFNLLSSYCACSWRPSPTSSSCSPSPPILTARRRPRTPGRMVCVNLASGQHTPHGVDLIASSNIAGVRIRLLPLSRALLAA